MQKNKITIAIAFFLTLTIAVSIVALPTVSAQSTRVTHAYIGATPNPVGVGQETLLHIGIMQQLSVTEQGWEGLTVTVTSPGGTTQTLGPFRTDSTGGTGHSFVPSEVGIYKLQTHFPEQVTTANKNAPGSPVGTTMLASNSRILELEVQTDPIPIYPGHPLPAEYWTRPIDSQLREWSVVSGNWLTTPPNSIAIGNNDAPETAHVLWATPLVVGGLGGGELGDYGYYTGDAYEGKFSGSVIINGMLFYNKYDSIGGFDIEQYVVAVDLHTGEELWSRALVTPDNNTRRLSFGQMFYWDSFNAHGIHAYLWATTGNRWDAFSPNDGSWVFTMTDVPGGSNLYGPKGEIIRYQVNLNNGYMTMWNSTAVIDAYWGTSPNSPVWGSWRPQGKTLNATGKCPVTYATPLGLNGYQWNKTIPTGLPGSVVAYEIGDKIVGSYMVAQSTYFGGTMGVSEITNWGISLKPGQEGQLLFNKKWVPPTSWVTGNISVSLTASSIKDGLLTYWSKETQQFVGFSTETGDLLWGPTEPQDYLDFLGLRSFVAYGKFFAQGMSGILHCYDALSGELQWTYEADDPYNQVLWANQWHIRPLFFAGGKIYMGTTEHSPVNPLTRGGPFVAVDIETGEEVFRADGLFRQNDWGGRAIIGDCIIATMDSYDQQIYAIGKGPSALTVSAPDLGVPFGSSVMIKGTIMDVSPGAKSAGLTMRFPNGVPAMSDESMSGWMQYVYKQFACPAEVEGVAVTIDVIDANGNYRNIGEVTSDATGAYSLMWIPDIPGEYTVIATFAGSKSYFPSYATNAFGVDESPAPTLAPTPAPESLADQYLLPATGGIIAAIAIVGVAIIALMLRKK